jgi:hypothetical protein
MSIEKAWSLLEQAEREIIVLPAVVRESRETILNLVVRAKEELRTPGGKRG